MAASDELHIHGVQYVISEALYGGRVTDQFDRRFLVLQTSEVLTEELCGDGFLLDSGGGKYRLPSDGSGRLNSLEASLEFVRENWPAQDDAAAYGLHAHADAVVRHRATTELLAPFSSQLGKSTAAAQLTQQAAASAHGGSEEGHGEEGPLQGLVDGIRGRLPADLDAERVAREFPPLYAAPMNV
eukprot:1153147-Prymnesium_polylepis.1